MSAFLDEVCDHILKHYAENTGDVCVVTPNRRAGLFFRKYFSQKITRPLWAPDILSIEDFVNRLTGLHVSDSISLLFEFYKVYQDIEQDAAEDIDAFFRWAPVLLRDFDEIDAQLESPGELFGYLKDLKRIEAWNPEGSPPTPFQQQYLSFFEKFERYHQNFSSHLLARKMAYQGLSFRQAAQALKQDNLSIPWEKVVFAGFNAMNQAEERIILGLHHRQQADIITDSDPYYLDNPMHEAGLFIRKYQRIYDLKTGKGPDAPSFFSSPKTINVLGIAKNVNQTRLAGNLLEEVPELTPDEHTAVVLANENLLIPMLHALPASVPSLNVTMGYPLKKTNLYGFFDALFQMHLTAARLNATRSQVARRFYFKDVIRFFGHQATAILWDIQDGEQRTGQLLRKLIQSNRSFCSFADLAKLSESPEKFSETFAFLDAPLESDPSLVSAAMLECCSRLDEAYRHKAEHMNIALQQSPWFLDYESLYYFSTLMRRLDALLEQTAAIGSLKTFYMLFRQTVQETRLAFSGEPLEGLQIMGMLETRNLDFKNIILLSANEDILPKGKSSHSFIPFEVKKKYGLQVHTDKDATYAYHFYRLLQRAENIYMIYNTQKGSMGSQEKSRFITQLKMELTEFNPRITFREEIISMTPARDSIDHHISIEKTAEIMQRLQQMADFGFSPSALNTYINCPLQFYLQKVARLDEAEQVEETLEASTMGNVVHGALESLYKPYTGRIITAADIEQMQRQAGQVLQQEFAKAFEGGDISSGKNLLLTRVAQRFTENFLEAERKFLESSPEPVTILQLESVLQANLEISAGAKASRQVSIRGMADRIDRVGQTIRVIDYKTGKVAQDELMVHDPETIIRDPKMSKTFQVICYSWLLRQDPGMAGDIESGIFSMRNLGAGLLTVKPGKNSGLEGDELVEHFDALLRKLLTEIMDTGTPFSQTENTDHCKYCPFRQLCHRFPET